MIYNVALTAQQMNQAVQGMVTSQGQLQETINVFSQVAKATDDAYKVAQEKKQDELKEEADKKDKRRVPAKLDGKKDGK